MNRAGVIFADCSTCNGRIGWIECPTGGWWAHEVHPDDDHDAWPVGDASIGGCFTLPDGSCVASSCELHGPHDGSYGPDNT